MIVAETPAAYRFVTQPAHARLAGQFAHQWGNVPFERPAPFPAVVAAAATHDDGWWTYDRQPHLGDDGTPVNFTELPSQTWIHLYDRGIAEVIDLDRYAGLLASMHGTGLRRRRYGLSPSWPDTPPAFADFVERQENHQRELLEALREGDGRVSPADDDLLTALHESGIPPHGTASGLWANYQLLQAWDSLSLSFCTTVSPPGNAAIEPVPRSPGGSEETLKLAPTDNGAFRVDPYPFDIAPFVAQVPTRTVRKDAFDTEQELVEAYYAAGREPFEVRLRPAD